MFVNNLSQEQIANTRMLIEALRSNTFRQIKGSLKCSGGYCCLGVACEISNLDKFNNDNEYLSSHGTMPKPVQEFYGFDHHNPRGSGPRLALLNDTQGYSFAQIADHIEEELNKCCL